MHKNIESGRHEARVMTDQFSVVADDLEKLAASLRNLTAVNRAGLEHPVSAPAADNASPPEPNTPPPGWRSTGTVIPGTRKPNRELIHVPDDEMDDDDRYFQERRRHGWLE
jgi:hypothetical protein